MVLSTKTKRSANAIAVAVACSLGLSCAPSALAFDLGNSTSSYQAPPAVQNGGVPINVGGHVRVVSPGSSVTAAEYAAVQQVLNTGTQSLNLNDLGAAVAGRFSVNQLPTAVLDSLAIPHGVTAIQDFAKSAGSLTLPGTLSNNGTFYAVSTSQAVTTATLAASNIYNGVNALLTSVLPSGGLNGYADAISNLNLTLSASNSIVNHGTISSAGSLNIVGANVNVDNTGGQLIANGAMNLGGVGTVNVNVSGGDLLSRGLYVQASNAANLHVQNISGVLSINAATVAVSGKGDTLRLGQICATGDPTIYFDGNIQLRSDNSSLTTNGDVLDIIASGDITIDPASPSAVVINTSGTSGPGGDVRFIAGNLFSGGTPVLGEGSGTGGKIDLTGAPGITSITTGGGSVTFTAYGGSSAGSGAITLPAGLQINTLGTTGGGSVSMTADHTISAGQITAFGPISLSAPDSVALNSTVTTSDNITIKTNHVINSTQVTGKNILVASDPGVDLQIDGFTGLVDNPGAATWKATGIISWVATPEVTGVSDNKILVLANSQQSLTAAQSNLIANGLGSNARIEVQDHALVHTHTPITLYTQHLVEPPETVGGEEVGIDGSPTKIISPTNKAVISSSGDLKLTTNFIAPGQSLAILAGGNITAAPNVSMIDLSNSKGQSGSALIVAGFHFDQTSDIFSIDAPSTSGGSVLLPNVSIKTSNGYSGPDADNVSSVGGNVTVVAHAGATNSGVILLKDITTKGTTFESKGGAVLLIGQGGVKVGNIDTSAVHSGSVSIYGGEPQLFGGPMTVENGNVTNGAIFTALPVANAGAAIDVGKINASSLFARAGNVTLVSDSSINVRGDITAVGQRSLQHSKAANSGGLVSITSLGDNVTVKGSIDVSGAAKLGEVAADDLGGANAGNITISSPANILITGNLKAIGGTTIGVDHAGNGGNIKLLSTDDIGNGMFGGTVQVNGYIDIHGANGKRSGGVNGGTTPNNGNGGNGGLLTVNAGQFVVKGKAGAYSIDARKGSATMAGAIAGTPGSITIDTYAVQSLPTNFNLLSNKATEVALPGGKLTVGIANPLKGYAGVYNGVAGGIITDTVANALKTGTFVAGTLNTAPGVTVTVHGDGSALDVHELQSMSFGELGSDLVSTFAPGTLVTPARAVVLNQLSRGGTQQFYTDHVTGQALDWNPVTFGPGAVITVDQTQVRSPFTSFVLDTENGSGQIQLNITGARPNLDLSASTSTKIRGTINFTTPNSVSTVNFGSKLGSAVAPALMPQGKILGDSTSTAVIGVTGANYKNVATISAGQLLFLNNAPTFTLQNTGTLGGDVVVNNEGVVPKLTIKSVGAAWDASVIGESIQLPLANGALAQRTLPITAAHSVDLTLQAAHNAPSPFGTVLVPDTVSIGGTLNGDNVKVTTLSSVGLNKLAVPTRVAFNGLTSKTTNFTVTSTGSVFFSNTSVTADGGNIQVLSGENIVGDNAGSGNSFTANGTGTAARPVGGGISFAIGTKQPSTELTKLLKVTTPSNDLAALGGSGSGPATGDVLYDNLMSGNPSGVLSAPNNGLIDLTFPNGTPPRPDATITQRGGAILFSIPSTATAANYIHFDTVHLTTSGPTARPIAYTSSAHQAMALIEMADDADYETSFGTIHAEKDAIFAIEQTPDALAIKVFSGPNHVHFQPKSAETSPIVLAPGEELLLTADTNSQVANERDHVGRRNLRVVELSPHQHARLAEFSIVSYLQNASYIGELDRSSKTFNKMLKTAAALHTVSRAKMTPFVCR